MPRSVFIRLLWLSLVVLDAPACTFNFDVTSQRTALENQVMGSYKELDDDLILVSSVRGLNTKTTAKLSPNKKRALDARQNQQFNHDDIEEFKQKQILGEAADGTVVAVPHGLAQVKGADTKDYKLAEQIAAEENRDRQVIWQRIIEANDHLTEKDLPNVRLTYARMMRDNSAAGAWYQNDARAWVRKQANGASEL